VSSHRLQLIVRRKPGRERGRWRGRVSLFLGSALFALGTAPVQGTPRMISYGYPNCMSCHISVQGRGLLNSYGRGIDLAQSYSKKDFTALLFGREGNRRDPSGNWDGRFGNLLMDFLVTSRLNQRIDPDKTDPALLALYRQTIFFDQQDSFRLNTEIGFQDSGLGDTRLGPNFTATGGDKSPLVAIIFRLAFRSTITRPSSFI
jgi:hypothetical protein